MHKYLYIGKSLGKRTEYKIGMTTQTCWARCRNADYRIFCAIDITDIGDIRTLAELEQELIAEFKTKFPIAKGLEYFKMSQYDKLMAETFFKAKIYKIFGLNGLAFECGEVKSYSY